MTHPPAPNAAREHPARFLPASDFTTPRQIYHG